MSQRSRPLKFYRSLQKAPSLSKIVTGPLTFARAAFRLQSACVQTRCQWQRRFAGLRRRRRRRNIVSFHSGPKAGRKGQKVAGRSAGTYRLCSTVHRDRLHAQRCGLSHVPESLGAKLSRAGEKADILRLRLLQEQQRRSAAPVALGCFFFNALFALSCRGTLLGLFPAGLCLSTPASFKHTCNAVCWLCALADPV